MRRQAQRVGERHRVRLAASRIALAQSVVHGEGLNMYVETHIQRVSEDPEAFCKIMDRCRVPFETNGDLSHYVYRGLRSSGTALASSPRRCRMSSSTTRRRTSP